MHSFDETKLSDIQREYFESMPEGKKDLIRKGAPVAFLSLETGEEICSFNTDNYEPPEGVLEMLARVLLPDIMEYFKDKKDDVVEQ